MTATYGDSELPIPIVVEKPAGICMGAEWRGEKGSIGDAGCVAMCLFYYVSPRTVSFEGLHMEEVPVTNATPTGYFAQEYSVWTMSSNFLEKTKHSHRVGVSSDGQMYFEGNLHNESY